MVRTNPRPLPTSNCTRTVASYDGFQLSAMFFNIADDVYVKSGRFSGYSEITLIRTLYIYCVIAMKNHSILIEEMLLLIADEPQEHFADRLIRFQNTRTLLACSYLRGNESFYAESLTLSLQNEQSVV